MVLKINDRIRTRRLDFFTTFDVHLKYDQIASSFKFDYIFNPDNLELKEMSCVGHYHVCTVEHEGKLLLTGYVISQAFNDHPEKQPTSLAGYSLPGFLQDCHIVPSQAAPLQSDGLSLRQIAEKFFEPFGIKMIVSASVQVAMDEKFDETTADEKQTVMEYVCQLAAQKNITVTHDEQGRVVFTKPAGNQQPFFHFEDNIPGTTMSLAFDGQVMHSHIKVVQQQDVEGGIPESEDTIRNPYVPFVYRPFVAIQNSGTANDTPNAARNVLSKELKGIKLVIETDRWDVEGDVWKPGQIITVLNPRVYLYKVTRWFVDEVNFVKDAERTVCRLTCVLPEVYTNDVPSYIFKGINLH